MAIMGGGEVSNPTDGERLKRAFYDAESRYYAALHALALAVDDHLEVLPPEVARAAKKARTAGRRAWKAAEALGITRPLGWLETHSSEKP